MKTGTLKSAFGAAPAKAKPTKFITNKNPDSSNNSTGSDAQSSKPRTFQWLRSVPAATRCSDAPHKKRPTCLLRQIPPPSLKLIHVSDQNQSSAGRKSPYSTARPPSRFRSRLEGLWHAGSSGSNSPASSCPRLVRRDFRASRKLLGAADVAGGRIFRAVSKREKAWTNCILN